MALRRELADSQVRRVTRRKPSQVVTVGTDPLQRRLQALQRFCRLRGQPEGEAPRAVAELAERAERDGERRDGGIQRRN